MWFLRLDLLQERLKFLEGKRGSPLIICLMLSLHITYNDIPENIFLIKYPVDDINVKVQILVASMFLAYL